MIGRSVALTAMAMLTASAMLAASADAASPKTAASHAAVRDWTRVVVATAEGGARMGNPAAPVKLIEYGSRTCPHCARFAAEGVPALKARYIATGKVSYEFRDFPIHNALDLGPILLGRCVAVARFFPLLDAMMAAQDGLSGRTAELPAPEQQRLAKATPNDVAATLARFYGYTDFVAKRGVPAARAAACLADAKAIDAIVARADAAERDWHVSGTPTFILNGAVVPNAADWASLEPALRTALAAK